MFSERSALKTLLLYLLFLLGLLLLATPAAGSVSFRFTLDGYQTVPAVGGQWFGNCVGVSDQFDTTLTINCVHNVPPPVGAGLYLGAAGQNGTLLYPFSSAQPAFAIIDLTPDLLADLVLEQTYIAITTPDHPQGRLRGQVRFERVNDAAQILFPLTTAEVAPTPASTASGRCGVSYQPGQDAVVVVCRHDVAHPDHALLQRGAPGQNGTMVLDLGNGESPILRLDHVADPTFWSDLAAGNVYLQIYSLDHPEGELRGQVAGCWNDLHHLCLNRERFAVELTATYPSGTVVAAQAIPETPDSGMFFFQRPDNRELLIKVLAGCALNGHWWVFFSATTNVGLELRVTDTRSGLVRTYTNPPGQAAQPVLDTAAFPSCP
jgi:hypothetical protein